MLLGENGARSDAAQPVGALEMHPHLSIRRESAERRRTLAPRGELDIATAPLLERAVERACAEDAEQLVLDMRRLDFIDAGGLRAVSAARALCAQQGLEFRIVFAGGQVERLFRLAGVLERLPFRAEDVRAVLTTETG